MSSCRAVGSGSQDMFIDGFARDKNQNASSCGDDRDELDYECLQRLDLVRRRQATVCCWC